MPDCPELSPHSGPLPAEERKPGRMEVGAGEMSVGFSEPAWRLSILPGAPAPPGVQSAYYLPSGLPAPWELSCLRASVSLCSCF